MVLWIDWAQCLMQVQLDRGWDWVTQRLWMSRMASSLTCLAPLLGGGGRQLGLAGHVCLIMEPLHLGSLRWAEWSAFSSSGWPSSEWEFQETQMKLQVLLWPGLWGPVASLLRHSTAQNESRWPVQIQGEGIYRVYMAGGMGHWRTNFKD